MDSPSPIQSLSVLANPVDLPRFDAEFLWGQFAEVLQSFAARGALRFDRLQPPSANALRYNLGLSPWTVLHLVAHSQERVAARYGTIALQASDGRAANLTVQALAAMLAPHKSLVLVVLQCADDGRPCFDLAVEELLAECDGLTAVTVPRLHERAQKLFLLKVYSGLLGGLSGSQLAADLTANAGGAAGLELVRVHGRALGSAILPLPSPPGGVVTPPPVASAPRPWEEILRRKREADVFDVFLCHHMPDKPAVQRIGQQLKEAGILPWLDMDELAPGRPWQMLIEEQIKKTRAAAVCIGASGIGPWQQQEMYALLEAFVHRGVPVIPVLLPDAPTIPELPIFLGAMGWVDFRRADLNPLARLIWGITGKRPDF